MDLDLREELFSNEWILLKCDEVTGIERLNEEDEIGGFEIGYDSHIDFRSSSDLLHVALEGIVINDNQLVRSIPDLLEAILNAGEHDSMEWKEDEENYEFIILNAIIRECKNMKKIIKQEMKEFK